MIRGRGPVVRRVRRSVWRPTPAIPTQRSHRSARCSQTRNPCVQPTGRGQDDATDEGGEEPRHQGHPRLPGRPRSGPQCPCDPEDDRGKQADPHQPHDGGVLGGGGAHAVAGRHHLRHLGKAGPVPEGVQPLAQPEKVLDQRVEDGPHRAHHGDRCDRIGRVVLLRLDHSVGGHHRRGAADGAADAEEHPQLLGDAKSASEAETDPDGGAVEMITTPRAGPLTRHRSATPSRNPRPATAQRRTALLARLTPGAQPGGHAGSRLPGHAGEGHQQQRAGMHGVLHPAGEGEAAETDAEGEARPEWNR